MHVLISALALLWLVTVARPQTLEFSTPEVIAASAATTTNTRPRLVADDDGGLHLIWAAGGMQTGYIAYASAAPAEAYGDAIPVSGDVSGYTIDGAGGPTIAVKGSHVAVGWDAGDSDNRAIWATRGNTNGGDWTVPARADAANARIRFYTAVDVFPDGRVAQCWLNFGTGQTDPHMEWAVQNEEGEFGDAARPTDAVEGRACECCWPAQLIFDDGQTVLVAFRNNLSNLREIHVTRSTDGGQTFDGDYHVDTSGWILNACPTTGPHLAAAGDTALITFMSGAGGTSRIYTARSTDAGASWEEMIEIDAQEAGPSRNYPQIAIRDSIAVVAWQEVNEEFLFQVRASYSTDAGQSWSPAATISEDPTRQDHFVTVAITPDHEVEIVFRGSEEFVTHRLYRSRGVFGEPSGVPTPPAIPATISLSAYPNPFNATLTLRYDAPQSSPVSLTIHDALGREVAELLDSDRQSGGGAIRWTAHGLGSGIYFVRMQTPGQSLARRVVYLK